MPVPIPKSIPREPGVIPTGGAYRQLQNFLSAVHQVQEIAIDDDHFKKGLVSTHRCGQKKSIVLDIDRSGISQYLEHSGYQWANRLPNTTTEIFELQR
ncbi:hypothetical protein INT44_001890 [Umbelopsis vinacea]|uniref:Uncharacterized protein n=1 Tax=Umbelopsis vinacea TaxID=44442 RepID=A0A8H7PR21_9FUNG|nr:hypothetical protein INT44_001890 [Umbelopsis vinacea]